MTPAPKCETCGRPRGMDWETDDDFDGEHCWRAFHEQAGSNFSDGVSACWRRSYERVRAALAERDREWASALARSHYDYVDGPHVACRDCDPLSALLSEAARSAPGERTE